jgi:hypothetical protein
MNKTQNINVSRAWQLSQDYTAISPHLCATNIVDNLPFRDSLNFVEHNRPGFCSIPAVAFMRDDLAVGQL